VKPKINLIPPSAILEVAQVMTNNEEKHGKENWKNVSWSDHYAAAQRHLLAFWNGTDVDPDGGLRHLAHACTRIIMLMNVSTVLDDRTYRKGFSFSDVFDKNAVLSKTGPESSDTSLTSLNEIFHIDNNDSLMF
jgi:hypothetical protein